MVYTTELQGTVLANNANVHHTEINNYLTLKTKILYAT